MDWCTQMMIADRSAAMFQLQDILDYKQVLGNLRQAQNRLKSAKNDEEKEEFEKNVSDAFDEHIQALSKTEFPKTAVQIAISTANEVLSPIARMIIGLRMLSYTNSNEFLDHLITTSIERLTEMLMKDQKDHTESHTSCHLTFLILSLQPRRLNQVIQSIFDWQNDEILAGMLQSVYNSLLMIPSEEFKEFPFEQICEIMKTLTSSQCFLSKVCSSGVLNIIKAAYRWDTPLAVLAISLQSLSIQEGSKSVPELGQSTWADYEEVPFKGIDATDLSWSDYDDHSVAVVLPEIEKLTIQSTTQSLHSPLQLLPMGHKIGGKSEGEGQQLPLVTYLQAPDLLALLRTTPTVLPKGPPLLLHSPQLLPMGHKIGGRLKGEGPPLPLVTDLRAPDLLALLRTPFAGLPKGPPLLLQIHQLLPMGHEIGGITSWEGTQILAA